MAVRNVIWLFKAFEWAEMPLFKTLATPEVPQSLKNTQNENEPHFRGIDKKNNPKIRAHHEILSPPKELLKKIQYK